MIPVDQQFRIRWSATDFGIRVTPGYIASDAFGGTDAEYGEKSATLPANATRWIYGDATNEGALTVSATHLGADQGALYYIGKVVTGQVGVVSVDQPGAVIPPDGIDLLPGRSLTLGSTTFSGNLNVTGNLTVSGTQTAGATIPTVEQRRFGLPAVSGVLFDGVTANTRVTSPCQDVGTGDFSMWVRVRVPSSVPSNSSVYAAVSGSAASAFHTEGSFLITQEANGNIGVGGYVATVFTLVFTVSGFIATYGGQVVDIVLTRATVGGTSTLTLYVNGVSVGSSTAAAAATSANSLYFHAGANAGIQPSHTLHRAVFFNRALSVSDVIELITCGVNQADMWGTQTPAYSSDFSAGADSWSLVRSTVTGNVDSILGVNDTLRVVVDSSATQTHYTFRATGLTAGKRFRLSLDYYVPSGQASVTGVRVLHNTGSVSTQIAIGNTPGSWQTIANQEFISSATRIDINAWNGTTDIFTGNGTDLFYIKNVVATRIGAIVNLDLTPGIGLFFPDMSSNFLHAYGNGGVSHTMPREYGQMTVSVTLAHSDISSTAGTTRLFDLPPNCAIEYVELDRTAAMDIGTTIDVGNGGSATRYASGLSAAASGPIGAASSFETSESSTGTTAIFIRKSGATTFGSLRARITYSIRG